jgi:hypothetical protein
MPTRLRTVVQAYADRQTPWGPPWWTYAVAIGAANLIRQLVMRGDVSTVAQVATFVGMVVTVATVVTVVHSRVHGRRAPDQLLFSARPRRRPPRRAPR